MTHPVYSRDPLAAAAASAFLPGLGQWLQSRRFAAIYFFGDVSAATLLGALVPELRVLGRTAAIAIAVWSVFDAGFAARRRSEAPRR